MFGMGVACDINRSLTSSATTNNRPKSQYCSSNSDSNSHTAYNTTENPSPCGDKLQGPSSIFPTDSLVATCFIPSSIFPTDSLVATCFIPSSIFPTETLRSEISCSIFLVDPSISLSLCSTSSGFNPSLRPPFSLDPGSGGLPPISLSGRPLIFLSSATSPKGPLQYIPNTNHRDQTPPQ